MSLSPALRITTAAALAAVASGGVWALRTFDPNVAESLFPRCLFLVFTGLYCPGCGLTRMLHALVHGDLAGAAAMNIMLLLMLPLVAMLVVHEAWGRRLMPARLVASLYNARAWLGVVVAFGVLRNLPWAPFSALAPG